MKKDCYDLALEVKSVSSMIAALHLPLNEDITQLTTEQLSLALWGCSEYLDRIADELDELGIEVRQKGEDND